MNGSKQVNVYATRGLYELFETLLDCEIAFNKRQARNDYFVVEPSTSNGRERMDSTVAQGAQRLSTITSIREQAVLSQVQALTPLAPFLARQNPAKKRQSSRDGESTGRRQVTPYGSPLRLELSVPETDLISVDGRSKKKRSYSGEC